MSKAPRNSSATRRAGLRGQLRWNPSDAVDITLSGDYTYQNQTNAPEVTTYSTNPNYLCGRYCTFADFSTKGYNFQHTNQFKGGGGSLNAVFKLADDLSLNSITAYRAYTATFGTDDDFSPGVESTPGDPNTRKEAGGFNRLRHHFFSQEVRLNGAFLDRAVEWTIGGYYSSQKTTYYTLQNIGYIVPGAYLTFMGNDPVNANSKAAFATAIIHPGIEGLTLTGGIRYTKEHKDYTFV
ncbi:MAG: hypothetical protein IIA09_11280, partial [Proteobacteria bacterium]|nr:hypothetical protein [Pseudomonadota bacterium]